MFASITRLINRNWFKFVQKFLQKTVCYLSYSISYVWKFLFFYLLNDIDVMSKNVIWYAKSRCFESIRSTWKLLVIERARKTDKLSLVLPWLSSQECHLTKIKMQKLKRMFCMQIHFIEREDEFGNFCTSPLDGQYRKRRKTFYPFPFQNFLIIKLSFA